MSELTSVEPTRNLCAKCSKVPFVGARACDIDNKKRIQRSPISVDFGNTENSFYVC